MPNMQSEVFETFRFIDVTEAKPLAAAGAFAKRDDVTTLQSDFLVLKWMLGVVITLALLTLGGLVTLSTKPDEISGQLSQLTRMVH